MDTEILMDCDDCRGAVGCILVMLKGQKGLQILFRTSFCSVFMQSNKISFMPSGRMFRNHVILFYCPQVGVHLI